MDKKKLIQKKKLKRIRSNIKNYFMYNEFLRKVKKAKFYIIGREKELCNKKETRIRRRRKTKTTARIRETRISKNKRRRRNKTVIFTRRY